MKIEIKDEGIIYRINNINWIRISDEKLTINYINERGETEERFDRMPEFLRVDSL